MNKMLSKLFSSIFKEKIVIEVKNSPYNRQPLLSLNKHSLDYYRRFVKGNLGISEDQASRKMSRNMLLAYPYKYDSLTKQRPRVWYAYGCLRFIVRDNEVIWMQNHQPVFKVWYKDLEKYERLNKEFGIEEEYIK
ncbi:hypothetical protein ABE073_04495 [Lederbergia citrisecunda]|uniref:hypothetical protein n=1 Tax=Lederbergia citrisecunda TaxID=2833583 RepID=UPI003D2B1415